MTSTYANLSKLLRKLFSLQQNKTGIVFITTFFQVDRLIKVTNDVNDATSDSDNDIDEEDDEQKYQLTQWFPSDFSATDQVPTLIFTTYVQVGM